MERLSLPCSPPSDGARGELAALARRADGLRTALRRCLSEARRAGDGLFSIGLSAADPVRLRRKGRNQVRSLPREGDGGPCPTRCATAVTREGFALIKPLIAPEGYQVVSVEDEFGLSPFFLLPIAEALTRRSVGFTLCRCPLNPEKVEHLVIPSLKLSYITVNSCHPCPCEPSRVLSIDESLREGALKLEEARLSFLAKTREALFSDALGLLGELHDLNGRTEGLCEAFWDAEETAERAAALSEAL